MKVLVVDSGGRGHVLAWSFLQDPRIERVFCAPGNPGMSFLDERITCLGEVKRKPEEVQEEIGEIVKFAQAERIDFAIGGAERQLSGGIVDLFLIHHIPIVGPKQAATILESSKSHTKLLCSEFDIPVAKFFVFSSSQEARRYIKNVGYPVVVKADGLAAGKGSIVCSSREEAFLAVETVFKKQAQGEWGGQGGVIEKRLYGRELSFYFFTDGFHLVPMGLAQDYKRAFDNDEGLNTGGMGAYSPHPLESKELTKKVIEMVAQPLIDGLRERQGVLYRGVLYLGLMLVDGIPYLLEINVRHGDPEAEAILPRLKTSLVDICEALLDGRLDRIKVDWSDECFCDVVLVSGEVKRKGKGRYPGYPGRYKSGIPIQGLEKVDRSNCVLFSAGISNHPERGLVTSGGRVLHIVGRGKTLVQARARAYQEAEKIKFEGKRYRSDIGLV